MVFVDYMYVTSFNLSVWDIEYEGIGRVRVGQEKYKLIRSVMSSFCFFVHLYGGYIRKQIPWNLILLCL